MTDETSASARQDAYLRWRQRIADKQATRRQPEETPAAKPNSVWDPEALFRPAEPSRPAPDEGASRAQTIDLRDAAEVAVTPAPPSSPAPPRPRHDAQPQEGLGPSGPTPDVAARPIVSRPDPRKERLDSVMARLRGSTTAPEAPTTDAGDAEAHPGHPRSATVDLTPIAETLRDLNQQRLEGIITDEEFNTRKAEIFGRASRH